jgi:hypothetical protein
MWKLSKPTTASSMDAAEYFTRKATYFPMQKLTRSKTFENLFVEKVKAMKYLSNRIPERERTHKKKLNVKLIHEV